MPLCGRDCRSATIPTHNSQMWSLRDAGSPVYCRRVWTAVRWFTMTFRGWLGLVLIGLVNSGSAGGATTVFGPETEWRWMKGTTEASAPDRTAWRQIGFNDRSWNVGPGPFFYGEALSGTELPDMRGGYTCVYLRKTFVTTDPSALGAVRLRALSDDGFVAWINGRSVARFNMAEGELPYNATALGTFNEPLPTETYDVADFATVLVAGTNVLAVMACNASISGSSDFVFEAALETEIDDVPPGIARLVPGDGSRLRELQQLTVVFSEAVEGVDAGDLLINGVGAVAVTGFGGDQYTFEFPAAPAGEVQLAWASGADIRDLSPLRNPFAGGSWRYTVDPDLPPPGVTISEFMADNKDTLNDEDGDASDWIEIENASEQVVDLAGWGLTDNPSNLRKWRFPAVSMGGRSRLVVFASAKDRVVPTQPLHTSFRLARDGGYLALSRPDGTIASDFGVGYPEQSEDVSYGRLPTDPLKTGYFVQPTPGAPNGEGGPGFAPDVAFSRIGGTFLEPFSLTLGTATAGAVVRYTLDGSVPTETSALATGPIRISTSTPVRARAFQGGLLPGRLGAEYYVLLNPTAAGVTSSLPLVLIHSYGGGSVPANGEYPAFLSIYEPRGGVASMMQAPDLRSRARLNIRGSSTLFQPKRNYNVEFRDEREANRDLSPLGLPEESDWILYAPNNFEPVLIHNPFIFRLSEQIGRYAPRTRFVEVYVQTGQGGVASSHYAGIYVLMEKIKRGPDRVAMAPLEPEHTTSPQVTGGYLLKVDRLDPGDSGLVAASQVMGFVEPKEEEITLPQRAPQLAYIRDYFNRFGQALTAANWRDPVLGWRAYVDEEPWIDHHLLNVLAFNVDALRLSAYLYKPREGKLVFGPIWDFDRALNSTDGRDSNPRVWRASGGDGGTDFFNYSWWGRLFRDPDFWQKWIDRYQELRRGAFETNALFQSVDELAGQVRSAQPREAARWPGFTTPRVSYANEVNILKTWLGRRIHFMDTNFLAAPTFRVIARDGGRDAVFLWPSGATLYYTTDGSDPRAAGGGVASTARSYTGPIPIGSTGAIRARSHNALHRNLTGANNPPISSPWSGPVEVRLATLPESDVRVLQFSEIHAHPSEPPPHELAGNPLLTASDFEFLEITNPGTTTVDLGDLRLVGGVRFDFGVAGPDRLAPGARIVLVSNPAAFAMRYGVREAVVGPFQGGLSAAGETLRIVDGLGRWVALAEFRTTDHPAADGLGFSLVTTEAAGSTGQVLADGWRVSGEMGGSPGLADPAQADVAPVVIHEVLTHTEPPLLDGIELRNLGERPAAVGGWWLSDDRERPFRYRIPEGTVIPPAGYLWLDESQFNGGPNPAANFRLDATGDGAWLFAANAAGQLTGYVHGFDFGAAPNGVSFGRELDCTGRESFLLQTTPTPGAPNSGPLVPALTLSEVHYHPLDIQVGSDSWNDTALEFVELLNVSDAPVELFDRLHPTNTWRLKDAVDFTFPPSQSVPPGGTVVVVNFDPLANPQATARFRAVYGVDASVVLVGPYAGSLPNSSGTIELARPDSPEAGASPDTGAVPYIVVDRVNYADRAPWTTLADGTGQSLTRVAWGRADPGSRQWVAAVPSPGRVSVADGDADLDGMPDGWEAAACLNPNDPADAFQDADGDGALNRDEYRARTHPNDAADFLGWVGASIDDTGRTRFLFEAKPGVAYRVEVSDALGTGGWRTLQELAPGNELRTIQVQELAGGGARFYRILVPVGP